MDLVRHFVKYYTKRVNYVLTCALYLCNNYDTYNFIHYLDRVMLDVEP